jgi:hypothetical protein
MKRDELTVKTLQLEGRKTYITVIRLSTIYCRHKPQQVQSSSQNQNVIQAYEILRLAVFSTSLSLVRLLGGSNRSL